MDGEPESPGRETPRPSSTGPPGTGRRSAVDVGARAPEASSVWPVRLLGDTRWLVTDLKWSTGGWRHPVAFLGGIQWDYRRAKFLYSLVRAFRPRLIIETGVHIGKSSVVLLSAIRANRVGRLVSIDLPHSVGVVNSDGNFDNAHVARASDTGYLVPAELRGPWTLRLGDAKQLLPPAVEEAGGRLEMFLHDSDHSYQHQQFEYETAWSGLAAGGVLASDDTTRSGAWDDFLRRHAGELEPLGGVDALRAVAKRAPSPH